MKDKDLNKISLAFGQLVYWSERRKRQTWKNQIEIIICSQFNVLMAIFFTKCISLFAND